MLYFRTFEIPIQIDQPGLGLSREFLVKGLNETLVQAYHSFQVDMAVLYGAERKDAEQDMLDVLNFEIAFANVRTNKIYLGSFTYYLTQKMVILPPNSPVTKFVFRIKWQFLYPPPSPFICVT